MITIRYDDKEESFEDFQTAKIRSGVLAEENIGKEISVYKGEERVWISKKKYSENDPVWSAIPNTDQCKQLWSTVIYQALHDATLGEISGDMVSDTLTAANQGSARRYFKTNVFELQCEFAGICHDSIREKLAKFPMKSYYEARI